MKRVIVTITCRLAWVAVFSLLLSPVAFAQSGANEKDTSGKTELRQPTDEEMLELLDGMKSLVNQSDQGLRFTS
ncbi:MAG: hypothetical protein MN733_41945 [Nitrososphaera sp.]|nr:hypothetical protein [Nitrososphaera sp.]